MKIKSITGVFFPLLVFFVLFFSFSCSNFLSKESSYDQGIKSYASSEPEKAEWDDSRSKSIVDLGDIEMQMDEPNVKQNAEDKPKRIYSANADLLVGDLEETKLVIESYTSTQGGYVESIHDNSIIIRIPATSFEATFEWILNLGKVRYKSIETADVSEIYKDLKSRHEISLISRDRLYKLLERISDTTEQVKILKEIGRLTEEIESKKLLLQSLDSFISYSRISITLESRMQLDQLSKQEIPFRWIRNLSPLYSFSQKLDAKIELDPGDDFALFDKEDIYLSENWDGTKIRISSERNDPFGDGEFWQKALLFHLKEFYAEGEPMETKFGSSTVKAVLWTSKDKDPFQYYVGVIVHKKQLHIVEIFSPKVNEKLFNQLFKAMNDGDIKF